MSNSRTACILGSAALTLYAGFCATIIGFVMLATLAAVLFLFDTGIDLRSLLGSHLIQARVIACVVFAACLAWIYCAVYQQCRGTQ